MSTAGLVRTTLGAVAVLSTLLIGTTSASAASVDRTAPTAPQFGYAEGFYCQTLIIGDMHSTDNVTPQAQLGYKVYDEGVYIGSLADGNGAWAFLQLTHTGTNLVTVRAVDAAGNSSAPSRAVSVWGYHTPGCVPYHL
jgi:hypothetical protein